jgi:uncharacterized protein
MFEIVTSLLSAQTALLFTAALLGGMFNGIAGGGSFITFPVLMFVGGLPSIQANATSTLALWFGAFASTFAYRHAMRGKSAPGALALEPKSAAPESKAAEAEIPEANGIPKRYFYALSGISLGGGMLGSIILLSSSDAAFQKMVPFLMLFATTLFAFNPKINQWLKAQGKGIRLPFYGALLLQFFVAIYGGYFGGGVSILMLAVMNFMGFTNLNAMNGLKSWLGSCMNGVAIIAFVLAQKIEWTPACIMAIGAVAGAYLSAAIAQRVPQKVVRNFVIGIAMTMTGVLFTKAWA